ncbi:unnamed protein product, partial [Mesorhabditis belari]|uniref:Protein kinase domain-containing protein n=1 Tax=Mesorhabditis belari TaxID=2138241 RepID=A0AAF3FG63_9BILA
MAPPRKAPIGRPVYKPTTTKDRFVRENFVVGKLLGKGAFGLVRQCQLKATKSVIAVKKIARKTRLNAVKAEFRALSMIGQKPYIVPVYALIRNGETFFILMECFNVLKIRRVRHLMTEQDMIIYAYNIISALSFVHELGIVHNDVKPANIVYDPIRHRFILIDFGLASFADQEQRVPPIKREEIEVNEWILGRNEAKRIVECYGVYVPDEKLGKFVEKVLSTALSGKSDKFRAGFLTHFICFLLTRNSSTATMSFIRGILERCWPGTTKKCTCRGLPKMCAYCEKLPVYFCNAWGTRGYRAPEVELRIPWRTGGVDIWAVGLILFSMIYRKSSILRPKTQFRSIQQMSVLLGSKQLLWLATTNGRLLQLPFEFPGVDYVKMIVLNEFFKEKKAVEDWPFKGCCVLCSKLVHKNVYGLCICKKTSQPAYNRIKEGLLKEVLKLMTICLHVDPLERNRAAMIAEHCKIVLLRYFKAENSMLYGNVVKMEKEKGLAELDDDDKQLEDAFYMAQAVDEPIVL